MKTRKPILTLIMLTLTFTGAGAVPTPTGAPPTRFEEIARYPAPEARQGVAVDTEYAYVVSNWMIGKYRKDTWEQVAHTDEGEGGPIIHYNDGFIHDGLLYCAHSNYPDMPSLSSIEIYNPVTLEHIKSHSFGHLVGFANWVEYHNGRWYVCFAHYTGRAEHPGADSSWTQIIEFDSKWRRLRGWAYPPEVVELFHGRSNSGGRFGPGGYLYITGHDETELYVLRFPEKGSYMEWVSTIQMTPEGQAFSFDPEDPTILWGIIKNQRQVIKGRLLP